MKKKSFLPICIFSLLLFSCQKEDTTDDSDKATMEQPYNTIPDPSPNPESNPTTNTNIFTDNFDGNGPLIDYVTNNAVALPETARVNGRYRAELTNNQNNRTLHFNDRQGRLDAKLLTFPFEFIGRNIGIGTLDEAQLAPEPNGNPYIFSGVQVHVEDFNVITSSHAVVGHRGGTAYTIEGKNTLNGSSSVNDIGANTIPQGKADIRIVGNTDRTLTVYWQIPNTDFENLSDNWILYKNDGRLPGSVPSFGKNVYVGLITYAYGNTGVPFVGTCDAIQIK